MSDFIMKYSPDAQEVMKQVFEVKGHKKITDFRDGLLKPCFLDGGGHKWNKCTPNDDGTVNVKLETHAYWWLDGWRAAGGKQLWATWYKDLSARVIKIQFWEEDPTPYLKKKLEEERPDIVVASVMVA